MDDSSFSKQQLTLAAKVINAHAGAGWLPPVLFDAVVRTVVTPTVELALVIKTEDSFGVVLTRRSHDERFWPGAWHIPGKIVVTTDLSDASGSFKSVLDRLIVNEIGDVRFLVEPQLLDVMFGKNERGAEVRVRFWGLISEAPVNGVVFTLNNLPKEFLSEQMPFATAAIDAAKSIDSIK